MSSPAAGPGGASSDRFLHNGLVVPNMEVRPTPAGHTNTVDGFIDGAGQHSIIVVTRWRKCHNNNHRHECWFVCRDSRCDCASPLNATLHVLTTLMQQWRAGGAETRTVTPESELASESLRNSHKMLSTGFCFADRETLQFQLRVHWKTCLLHAGSCGARTQIFPF